MNFCSLPWAAFAAAYANLRFEAEASRGERYSGVGRRLENIAAWDDYLRQDRSIVEELGQFSLFGAHLASAIVVNPDSRNVRIQSPRKRGKFRKLAGCEFHGRGLNLSNNELSISYTHDIRLGCRRFVFILLIKGKPW
jgi:hypothetical protein